MSYNLISLMNEKLEYNPIAKEIDEDLRKLTVYEVLSKYQNKVSSHELSSYVVGSIMAAANLGRIRQRSLLKRGSNE